MNNPPPVSATEVQELITAISRLSLALETYNSALTAQSAGSTAVPASATPSSGDSDWTLIEDSEALPKGYRDENLYSRIVEVGPPELPPALLSLGRHRLTNIHPGSDFRVRRAFVAGFWAWVAQATSTNYSPAEAIGLPDSQFVILRSWIIDPKKVKVPLRVTRKSEVQKLCGRDPTLGSIVQGFASLTEVHCFCSGAGIEVPPLYQWRTSSQA